MPFEQKDSIDLEHLEQILRTRGWEIYRERVREMQVQAGVDLINAETVEQFHERRGALKTINRIADLPAILTKELAQNCAKETT